MILNYREIEPIIVEDRNNLNFNNASYDLSAGTIMDMKGKIHKKFYKVPPQGMVYVISKEKIKLDYEIIGFAHVKTSLTQKGIMATNIGIIDPGYEGYISTLLINFSKQDWTINLDSQCLRLTFNKINALPQGSNPKPAKPFISKDDYVTMRRCDTDRLDKKFLNLSSVSRAVLGKVTTYLLGFGLLFTAASFAVAFYFQNKVAQEKELETTIKKYDAQTNTVQEENKLLKTKLENFENLLNESKKRIEELEKKKK
jgi:dUTPase